MHLYDQVKLIKIQTMSLQFSNKVFAKEYLKEEPLRKLGKKQQR